MAEPRALFDRSDRFFPSREPLSEIKAEGWRRIVNPATTQTNRAFLGGIAYGASKTRVVLLTRATAVAGSLRGITANANEPGFSLTDLTGAVRICFPVPSLRAMSRDNY